MALATQTPHEKHIIATERTFTFDFLNLGFYLAGLLVVTFLLYRLDVWATGRLDTLLESYYGPEMYDIYKTRYDPTERWLKEAYREQMEAYKEQMKRGGGVLLNDQDGGVFGDLERNFGESWSLTRNDRNLFEEETKWDQNLLEDEEEDMISNDLLDWSDEDVLLGYLISGVEERGGLDREELEDILNTIYSRNGIQGFPSNPRNLLNNYDSKPSLRLFGFTGHRDPLQGLT